MCRRMSRIRCLVERQDVGAVDAMIDPLCGSISRMMARPVVDLPQPDSPTSDSVSPGVQVEGDILDRVHAAAHAAEEARSTGRSA